MHEPTRDHELPTGPLLRALPFLGWAAIVCLALAWNDRLPGGYFLRRLVEPNSARDERALAEHAAQRLSRFARENASAPQDAIVFIGSSTIERFPLEECFPGKPCLNRGILSASAPLLERFLDTLLPSAPVAGIVLYTGSIDLREPGRSADTSQVDTVVTRVRSLLDRLAEKLPQTPIALIGVLPARRMVAGEVAALELLDERLSQLARERGIAFVVTARAPLSSPEGALAEELSADDLHLNERGYRALSAWILSDGGEVGRRLRP
jgi:lysophospholipase L1-like esterase